MKLIALIISIILGYHVQAQKTGSDAEFKKITSEYTLNKDGSVIYHHYKKLQLNTHFSFNRLYGETFIVYDPARQQLKINISRTTQQDGTVVEAPFNAFNEVLPRFAANAPHYNGLREMVVTHPGLEVGAVIELDYTLTSNAGFYPGLMADEVLTESSPVQQRELIVHVPSGTTLNYKVLNIRTEPEINESKSGTTYTFIFNGLEENTHESNQPVDQLHLPRVFFSTLTFKEAIASIADQEAFAYRLDASVQKYVQALKEKKKNDVEFVLEVQKMIAESVNTWPVPPQSIGYNMRPPMETWKSNGGTPCEKTLLMTAIFREAGINAHPVMVVPGKLYDEQIGCLPLAEKILLQVNPRETEQMYLSAVNASDQNLVFSLTDKTLVLFEPSKQYVESIVETFTNKVITNGHFSVGDDFTLAGTMEVSLTERTNPYYSFVGDSAFLKTLIAGGISGKDITSAEIINSAQFRTLAKLTAESKKAFREQDGYYFWEIPVNKKGVESWRISYLHSERTAPFEVPFTVDEEYSYTILLPENTLLLNAVELTERETDFGKLVLSTHQKGNEVTVKRLLVISNPVIATGDYAAFKEMMDLWNEKNFRKLVLKKEDNP